MRIIIALISIALCAAKKKKPIPKVKQLNIGSIYQDRCIADLQAANAFHTAYDAFAVKLLKMAADPGHYFITISPYSVWLTLAAIAEGADKNNQKEILTFLNLPINACSRQKIYHIAVTQTSSSKYVNIFEERVLVIDKGVQINLNWSESMKNQSLIDIVSAPIRSESAIKVMKQFTRRSHLLDLSGNSVLLNSMEYNGHWTNAFSGASVERSPFYNYAGQQIGSVDLMKLKRKVRLGYVASINSKILELPLGHNGEYRMIFVLVVDNYSDLKPMLANFRNYTMLEVMASLQESTFPVDVAIPRFTMNSEIDMKKILQDMGVVNMWQDPGGTWNVSTPPALPTSYIQRSTVTLHSTGVLPPIFEQPSPPLQKVNEQDKYWKEFIADRPFMFALVDAQTYTTLMVALYSKPTYPLV